MLDDAGATGSAVGEEMDVSDGFARFIEELVSCCDVDDSDADDSDDLVVYDVAKDVGLLVRSLDAVDA